MPKDFDVHVDGLRDFRRDLKKTDAEAAKALQRELKEAVGRVSIEAAATAPRKTGTLARSYRPFTRGNIAGVRSPLPYAGVIEFGGTITPKGAPVLIRRFGDAIEQAARRAGWND
jgi:hypothetical protein